MSMLIEISKIFHMNRPWEKEVVLLVRGLVISRHVLLQRRSTAAVQEVLRDTHLAAIVGRGKTAVEVGKQVDRGAVVRGVGPQETGHGNIVRLGVVTDNDSIDQHSQKRVLIRSSVLLQQCGGVVVADGHVSRAAHGRGGTNRRQREESSVEETHDDGSRSTRNNFGRIRYYGRQDIACV